MSKKKRLTAEQRQFCLNCVTHPEWSAKACYMDAYPKCTSDVAARVGANKNLKKAYLRAFIKKTVSEAISPEGIIDARLLMEEARIAFFDPIDIIDEGTQEIKSLRKMPERIRRAVHSIKITRTQSLRDPDMERTEYHYKFQDKGRSLERLERILGMFEKDNDQKPVEREKLVERWVAVPSDRELTLVEWQVQVEELNRLQKTREAAEKEKSKVEETASA